MLFEEVSQQLDFWYYRFLLIGRFDYNLHLFRLLLLSVLFNFLRHFFHFQLKVHFCFGFGWSFSSDDLTHSYHQWYLTTPSFVGGCFAPCTCSSWDLLMFEVVSCHCIFVAADWCFPVLFHDCVRWTNYPEFQDQSDHLLHSTNDLAFDVHLHF